MYFLSQRCLTGRNSHLKLLCTVTPTLVFSPFLFSYSLIQFSFIFKLILCKFHELLAVILSLKQDFPVLHCLRCKIKNVILVPTMVASMKGFKFSEFQNYKDSTLLQEKEFDSYCTWAFMSIYVTSTCRIQQCMMHRQAFQV